MIKKFYFVWALALLGMQPLNARLYHTPSLMQHKVIDVTPSVSTSTYIQHTFYPVNPSKMTLESFASATDKTLKDWDVYLYDDKEENKYMTSSIKYDEKGRKAYEYSTTSADYVRYAYGEDAKGRIISVDCYKYDAIKKKESLQSHKEYDYDHVGEANQGKAYLVKSIDYNSNGDVSSKKEYTWLEPVQSYVELADGNYKQAKLTVNGDDYVITVSVKNGNDTWVKQAEETLNSVKGEDVVKYYDETTGALTSASGSKTEVQQNGNTKVSIDYTYSVENGGSWIPEGKSVVTHENGATTTISYSYDADGKSWTPKEKGVVTDNYNDPWIYDEQNKHRESLTYSYDSEKKDFVLSSGYAYDWVHKNPNVVYVKDYGDEESYMFMYDDQGNSMGKVPVSGEPGHCEGVDFGMFKDGRYVLTEYLYASSDGPCTNIIMFYDQDNKETARYRLRELENASRKYAPLEIYKDGKWQKMQIPEEPYIFNLGDMYSYNALEFNKEGYPTKIDDECTDGVPYETYEYTYTANGYTEKEYEYDDGTRYLNEISECEVATDGTYTSIDKCYYPDGELDDCDKKVTTPEGVIYSYDWDDSKNDFQTEPSYSEVKSLISYENGVTTTIRRSLENGQVVETDKTCEQTTENGKVATFYEKVNGEWVPKSKSEHSDSAKPQFSVVFPKSDIKEIIGGNLITDVDSTCLSYGNASSDRYYSWDATSASWKLTGGNENSFSLDGNTLSYANKNSGDSEREEKYSYTCDDANRLVKYERLYNNASVVKTFEYDEKGRLSVVTQKNSDKDYAVKYILHYQDEATGINPKVMPTSYCRMIVRGKTISAEGAKLMVLYSADGKLVAQSTNGTVEAPASGLYIVNVDGVKTKVLIK